MQSASSRIWTRVAVSISYDDNHYTTVTSKIHHEHLQNTTGTSNMCLILLAWVKKTAYWLDAYWLSGKEKVIGAVVNKESHANSLLGHEINFFEKDAYVNITFYCQLLRHKFTLFIEWPSSFSIYFNDNGNYWFY